MSVETLYIARRASRDREPVRWEVIDDAGRTVRTFAGGSHPQDVAERWAADAIRAGSEAEADRLRNSRAHGL